MNLGKIIEKRKCKLCGEDFVIRQLEYDFYVNQSTPLPKYCHKCKVIQMESFYNVRYVFENKCSITGKKLISSFDPESPQKIVDRNYFFSNEFDAIDYGEEFNFDKDTFGQLFDFFYSVPIYHNTILNGENCEYSNGIGDSKNCYMCYDSINVQDCYYSYGCLDSSNIVGSFSTKDCQNCFECVDIHGSYKLFYSKSCQNCRDSYFLIDCKGCENCFMCRGLRNQKYYIENKQYSKDDYSKKLEEYNLGSKSQVNILKEKFDQFIDDYGYDPDGIINKSENCTGGFLENCKNCINCYSLTGGEDSIYCMGSFVRGSLDCLSGDCDRCYMSFFAYKNYNVKWGLGLFHCTNVDYSLFCGQCTDCFMCIGLVNKSYCIMNKQYSKDDYNSLKNKIIEKMKKEGTYGQFFPTKYSPFAINYSRVNDQFKNLDYDKLGGRIFINKANQNYNISDYFDDIKSVPENILQLIFKCKETNRPFKLIKQEIDFYKKYDIPLPDTHPEARMDRLIQNYWSYENAYSNHMEH